jgi:hypothetical protein
MDDKTSLHNDHPFNPAAEAANLPETVSPAETETPPDEVMAALEMLAAFPEDPQVPLAAADGAIEASGDAPSPAGPELEPVAPEIATESAVDPSIAPATEADTATPGAPDASDAEAPLVAAIRAVPTHAEHRDGPPLLLSDDEQGDEPFDNLEDGIASIFARLHAETQQAQDEEHEEDGPEADDGITFHLLGELDRLWHRAER